MAQRGYDYAWSRPSFAALAALGTVAVGRYVSDDTGNKNITLAEAQAAAAHGIRIWTNFEYAAGGFLLGHGQGVHDANLGNRIHLGAGGPATAPIYFSGDKDVRDYAPDLPNDDDPAHARAKLGPAAGYWDAVVGEIGLDRSGAYGGYWLIKRLFAANLIKWGWQTYAWSGGLWHPRAQIRQVANGVGDVPGADMDRDEIWAECGAWFPGGVTPTPAPTPAPQPAGIPVVVPGARTLSLTTPRMRGTDVMYLQRFIGPAKCGDADGIYGPNTASGVTWYERMRGIHTEIPGIAGPEVWRNILHG